MGWKGFILILLVFSFHSCEREVIPESKSHIGTIKILEQDSLYQENQTFMEEGTLEARIEVSNFNFWKVIAIVSIVFNLIYFTRWLILNEKKNKYSAANEIVNGENQITNHYVEPEKSRFSRGEADSLYSNSRELEKSTDEHVNIHGDEKSPEIELTVDNSNPKEEEIKLEEPKVLYAEKATETGMFSNVSERLDPYKSYFKFTLLLSNKEEAEFEVLDSEFILKQGANQPDLYLYTVCDPENSNQNFTGEIITVKKGIAELVNGNWQIKKGNKAKIKFQ